MPEITFGIGIEDEASAPAADVAEKLNILGVEFRAAKAGMAACQAGMKAMSGDMNASKEQMALLKAEEMKWNEQMAAAARGIINLGGKVSDYEKELKVANAGVKNMGASTAGANTKLKSMLGIFKSSGAPIGGFVGQLQNGIKALGAGGIYGVAIMAGLAIIAMGFAAVGVIGKMAQFALASSDASRSQGLLLEGITQNEQQANALQKSIKSVSAMTALEASKVNDLGMQLADAGLRGAEFQAALEAASMAASAGGSKAEAAFMKQATAIAKAGGSLDDLVDKTKNKFGTVAAKQAIGFKVQMDKLKTSFSTIFDGVNIEPFLVGLSKITSMFDVNSVSGKALATIVNKLMDPLFATVAKLEPFVTGFFEGMVIGALIVAIAVMKIKNSIMAAFGNDAKMKVDWVELAMYAGAAAVGALVVGLGILTGLLAVVAAAIGLVGLIMFVTALPATIITAVAIAALAAVVYIAIKAIGWLIGKFQDLTGINLKGIGQAIMNGLLEGIVGGANKVLGYLGSLGGMMEGVLSAKLEVHSPSLVFADIGMNTAAGLEQGIVEGTDGVAGAVENMIEVPALMDIPVSNTAIDSSRHMTRGGDTTTQSIVININAPSGKADDIAEKVKAVLAQIFDGLLIQMGAESMA